GKVLPKRANPKKDKLYTRHKVPQPSASEFPPKISPNQDRHHQGLELATLQVPHLN
ncbi:hypothetical protein P7K49_037633, partial [Saguinus oedipus]